MRSTAFIVAVVTVLALCVAGCGSMPFFGSSSGNAPQAPAAGRASAAGAAPAAATAAAAPTASSASTAPAAPSAATASAAAAAETAPAATSTSASSTWSSPTATIGRLLTGGWITSSAPTGIISVNSRGVHSDFAPMTGRIGPPTQ